MRFRQSRRRSIVTAKNFTIAMVVVNAAGLLAVQQKLKQSEIPNAYALDDGAQPVMARSEAVLPERRVLPQVALTAPAPLPPETAPALPAMKPLPVIDLASLDLIPVTEPAQAFEARPKQAVAVMAGKPVQARAVSKRPRIAIPSAKPAQTDNFSAAFDIGLEAAPSVGLSTANVGFAVSVGAPSPDAEPTLDGDAGAVAPAYDLIPAVPSLTAPTLAPASGESAPAEPAAPSETAPAELPAAA
jgi:hypothetical protein